MKARSEKAVGQQGPANILRHVQCRPSNVKARVTGNRCRAEAIESLVCRGLITIVLAP
jgi:predicted transcriptional regulator with HTH domain